MPAYDQLLKLASLQQLNASTRLNYLANLTEEARERKDNAGLQKVIIFIKQESPEQLTDDARFVFHYNASNAYAYIVQISDTDLPLRFEDLNTKETEQEIIHLRRAFVLLEHAPTKLLKAQVCTNLGNSLSHVGRFVEAIDYWKKAVQFASNFGMATGNLGKSLLYYAHLHYDEGQRYLMGKFAYDQLKRAIRQKGTYSEAKAIFKKDATDIENYYGKKNLKITEELDNFSGGRSNMEKDYREWCLYNTLFVNPLNDVTDRNIANADTLFLPSLPAISIESPFVYTLFNQIKQEYVSARFLFFEGLRTDKSHFSDRGNMQIDTLDYAIYGFNSEKLKIAYRLLYSLFDKMGFLLNDYFKLDKEHNRISFRTIWYKDPKKKELYEQFTKTTNWPLRGLFWLSKDLVEKESELSSSLLPDAREIVTTRNFIEHKSFKIVMEGQTEMTDNGLTYSIAFNDFYAKTMTLLKLSRAALIYLAMAIHQEERKGRAKG